jgi:hypothetical protein
MFRLIVILCASMFLTGALYAFSADARSTAFTLATVHISWALFLGTLFGMFAMLKLKK